MEVWKDVVGYEGLYEVSNLGNVRRNGYLLKPFLVGVGYYTVSLYLESRATKKYIHRLVASAFIPNPTDLPLIDHINRVKTDNRVENLRWVSSSKNANNAGIRNTNTSGFKNISTRNQKNNQTYWVIRICSAKINKLYNKSKYTLEQVVEERDKIYAELGLERLD